jgi:hypothetical protein
MSTPLIPKLFVQHVAGGLPYLAERLWNAPHPQLWDRTPAELWNHKDALPFTLTAYRRRILHVLAPCKPDPLLTSPKLHPLKPVVQPIARDEVSGSGNGKSAEDLPRSEWELLFGIEREC